MLRRFLGGMLAPKTVPLDGIDLGSIRRVLIVRQDARLGNLVLMTPLLGAVRDTFGGCELDVLVSRGFEEILADDPNIDRLEILDRRAARLMPWLLPHLMLGIRRRRYDLAIDASDGRHVSLLNVLLTALSGAEYRLGYDREDAASFLNLLVPPPDADIHMADALASVVTELATDVRIGPMMVVLADEEREFADGWLSERGITDLESFFVIHPGGRGKKQWGPVHFADLIDRLHTDLGVRLVVIAGPAEEEILALIADMTDAPYEVLDRPAVRRMAAVIERCDLFISNDTGPMHVASALGRPTVGIFTSSNYRTYGPRGYAGRVVAAEDGNPTCDDVMVAITDLLGGLDDDGNDTGIDAGMTLGLMRD